MGQWRGRSWKDCQYRGEVRKMRRACVRLCALRRSPVSHPFLVPHRSKRKTRSWKHSAFAMHAISRERQNFCEPRSPRSRKMVRQRDCWRRRFIGSRTSRVQTRFMTQPCFDTLKTQRYGSSTHSCSPRRGKRPDLGISLRPCSGSPKHVGKPRPSWAGLRIGRAI
jgi:hypothetical protein